jgi:hypothetical protein
MEEGLKMLPAVLGPTVKEVAPSYSCFSFAGVRYFGQNCWDYEQKKLSPNLGNQCGAIESAIIGNLPLRRTVILNTPFGHAKLTWPAKKKKTSPNMRSSLSQNLNQIKKL